MVYMFGNATFGGSNSLISIKLLFFMFFVEIKQRFTGTQYASLFTITSTTVVRDGLGTNQKLGARNVSIILSYNYCSYKPS